MPALICSAAKLNDDVIAGLGAKSAPIQIKVEVFPCTSAVRKILWVLSQSQRLQNTPVFFFFLFCLPAREEVAFTFLTRTGNREELLSDICRYANPLGVSKVHNRWNRADSVLCKVYTGSLHVCVCVRRRVCTCTSLVMCVKPSMTTDSFKVPPWSSGW